MTTLFLFRHGNTFDKGDTILRVGARTDLPLSNSGQTQIQRLAKHLIDQDTSFDALYTGPLKRHRETANLLASVTQPPVEVQVNEAFSEVDYGQDDGKPESHVQARVGEAALEAWNSDCLVPDGWLIDVPAIKTAWRQFAEQSREQAPNGTIALVTSGGTLRFALDLLPDFEAAKKLHGTKVSTGAYCILEYVEASQQWQVKVWNQKA